MSSVFFCFRLGVLFYPAFSLIDTQAVYDQLFQSWNNWFTSCLLCDKLHSFVFSSLDDHFVCWPCLYLFLYEFPARTWWFFCDSAPRSCPSRSLSFQNQNQEIILLELLQSTCLYQVFDQEPQVVYLIDFHDKFCSNGIFFIVGHDHGMTLEKVCTSLNSLQEHTTQTSFSSLETSRVIDSWSLTTALRNMARYNSSSPKYRLQDVMGRDIAVFVWLNEKLST